MFPTLLGYYVHDLPRYLIQTGEGSGFITYYGLAYALGFVAGVLLLSLYWKKGRSPIDPDRQQVLILALFAGVLVGGRLGYLLLYDLSYFVTHPWIFFQVWKGGMASHGGFLGVGLALFWFSRKYSVPPLRLADIVVTAVPPGLFFGRIANFIGAELWGHPSNVPWAVVFGHSDPSAGMVPRHPSQLYEACLEGLIPFVYLQLRFWLRGRALPPGQLVGEFLVIYSVGRIIGEQFRVPDQGVVPGLGLSWGSFYSLFLALAGIVLIVYSNLQGKEKPHSHS